MAIPISAVRVARIAASVITSSPIPSSAMFLALLDVLKAESQRHVLASSGYFELGMFENGGDVFEKIEPEGKPRNDVLGPTRV
jgi:hypothetical protein